MYNDTLKNWLNSSYLSKNNQSYIEQIYKDFLKNPDSIDSSWIKVFKQLSIEKNYEDQSSDNLKNNTYSQLKHNIAPLDTDVHIKICDNITYIRILQLINSFRIYGHQCATLDPLQLRKNEYKNYLLDLESYNAVLQNIHKKFDMTHFGINKESMTLSEIYEFLKQTYCGPIGIEYMHILDINTTRWIQNYFESTAGVFNFHSEEKKQFLEEIIAAEGIERYLGTKFPGVKRFSLEGGDVLIPMLKEIIRHSVCHHNIKEIFLGMAHRGRLNVLINILGKNPQDLFNEFSNKHHTIRGSGDVKYHQGFYSDITINGEVVHLSLSCNPSHLEIVSPVVMGCARARIDQLILEATDHDKKDHNIVLPVTIHGDAAISAQGIVQETFNMSKTHAYDVGGALHIIINNQIGFTTSNIHDIRSTQHCTDIAKMIQAPIFHVNADNVDAVVYVTRAALSFRNTFKRDVIIDLVCYRRHGHNEADEPSVTQPIMYKKIRNHPTVLNIYSDFLNKNGIISANESSKMINTYREKLEKEHCVLHQWMPVHIRTSLHTNRLHNNKNILNSNKINTQYLKNLAYRINDIPSSIAMHSRVKKIYDERIEMALGNRLFDWGSAEVLAYATLLDQGISIRLSGEDAARGTFFHRHSVIHDQNDGTKYIPLTHLINTDNKKGSFFIWNSVLSEEASLAFEYGYSSLAHNMLVIWEAQFGDFSNGAQIVIDQFISSGEQKWGQLCGLVMLLPHGYEGQGPEHSSARIERYLQLCAEYNLHICIPSTPDQMYHILLQHATCDINLKKPLIIISPKSLLRHPMVTTSLKNLVYGSFKTVFNEIDNNIISNKINRVIICSGKVYYDLLSQRRKNKQYNIAIIRIEQLYPFPYTNIQAIFDSYLNVQDFAWCQEEPKNQGAWYYIQDCLHNIMPSNITLNYIGRPDSAAPAVGYFSVHQQQQKKLIDDALNLN
ncbi:2-oxoglutarate dehydrogenase E1 component [Blochmannia endosymbiont of Camponotus sp. C-003]|uniref:2-oxoglutarate dehydrogenase E1 component n=1 Tax=unclassified Candidatus Blochmanniella TaxID=711328 RepID=UPI002023F7E7|nr:MULTISPECIES: 2-oxoglutarate dehydrogenase E1 component [unclassified Candidatus Blochmannia]URJ23481.1 2-oxoglutarate dehydrogenase E1 component [Blochmannia endosymbiont of Camponotus sp. C-003]URJ28953.1 2-oxoglutarate dehydrogenase E1 component [Blochmannia endosymbiont of Camponotus sp. C-046]